MGFRTVVVSSRCKCSYKNGYMVLQNTDIKMVHLSEIDSVIFETVAVSISGVLLSELCKKKVRMIFCDERHLPYSHLVSLSANYKSSECLLKQVEWKEEIKDYVWANIVYDKILKQSDALRITGKEEESSKIKEYLDYITPGDVTNREGFAAKVYFNGMFGKDFTRDQRNDDELNACLDYGYAVLLAIVSREIVKNGYNLALGIHHKGVYNPHNLACDIMEPYRPIVDLIIVNNFAGSLDSKMKEKFWNLGNIEVNYQGKGLSLPNAINEYFRSVCFCLEEEMIPLESYRYTI